MYTVTGREQFVGYHREEEWPKHTHTHVVVSGALARFREPRLQTPHVNRSRCKVRPRKLRQAELSAYRDCCLGDKSIGARYESCHSLQQRNIQRPSVRVSLERKVTGVRQLVPEPLREATTVREKGKQHTNKEEHARHRHVFRRHLLEEWLGSSYKRACPLEGWRQIQEVGANNLMVKEKEKCSARR